MENNTYHIFDIARNQNVNWHCNPHNVIAYLRGKDLKNFIIQPVQVQAGFEAPLRGDKFMTAYIEYVSKAIPVTPPVHTYYTIGVAGCGSSFAQDGYSKYAERWKLSEKGQLSPWEIYGYEQALEHVEELRASEYDGERIHIDTVFEIRVETRVVTKLLIVPKQRQIRPKYSRIPS